MRAVDPDLLAAMASGSWRPLLAVRLDWPNGEVRFHSRLGTALLDGQEWEGVGDLGSVEGIEEAEGVAVREVVLGLTGFLADQLATLSGFKVRNRTADIYLGAVDGDETQLGGLLSIFSGQMRAKSFEVKEANAFGYRHQIQVKVQNHTANARKPITVRHEHPRLAALRHEAPTWPE